VLLRLAWFDSITPSPGRRRPERKTRVQPERIQHLGSNLPGSNPRLLFRADHGRRERSESSVVQGCEQTGFLWRALLARPSRKRDSETSRDSIVHKAIRERLRNDVTFKPFGVLACTSGSRLARP
jgi:hypothetical protein